MKKKIILFIVSVLFTFNVTAQENTLIIAHPTENNLKLFTYLVENKLIDIDNLKVVAVYHQKEVYDYSESRLFLENKKYPFIELKEISEEIHPNELFQKNNCTSIYSGLFENSKGIIFFGGPDVPPSMYDEQTSLLTSISDPYRHYFEASFLFHLLGGSQNSKHIPFLAQKKDYTVYAICLGMQTMNVAAGGTLIQDIPSEVYNQKYVEEIINSDKNNQHRNYNRDISIDSTFFSGSFHEIKITDYKPISGSYQPTNNPFVYSNHHQAIKKLGRDITVIATSTDSKIIEAVAHKNYPNVLGIQFHPEGTYLYEPEIKSKQNPEGEFKAAKQILIDHASFEFHLKFWKTFSDKMNSKN